ncbi:hypothetical protein BH09BAC2_BH09BAC2_13670 [soil metagenome]
MSIANTYFKNKAVAFTGSSTIAYGPAAGQGVADLITQYFIKNIIAGASTGRALLEARQKFIAVSGPHLDPYELKTLAQFYLPGDPAMQVVIEKIPVAGGETIVNRRLNLHNKGVNLAATVATAQKKKSTKRQKNNFSKELKNIFIQTGFTGNESEHVYELKAPVQQFSAFSKNVADMQNGITYRALIQSSKNIPEQINPYEVLVLKEKDEELLGWKVYHRK